MNMSNNIRNGLLCDIEKKYGFDAREYASRILNILEKKLDISLIDIHLYVSETNIALGFTHSEFRFGFSSKLISDEIKKGLSPDAIAYILIDLIEKEFLKAIRK